jgi:ABC-type multidrug transport system permease subunit
MKTYHPLKELMLCRMRSFIREPDAVFWTYVFPLVMIVGLGIAFRNKPAERVRVDVVGAERAEAAVTALRAGGETFDAEVRGLEESKERLRRGRTDLVVLADEAGYTYRFDPARPESVLARAKAEAALESAAGRHNVTVARDEPVTEPGSRYIDFLVPGLMGMNLLGGGLWGVGFVTTDLRVRKLLKRLSASPMRRTHFLMSLLGGRMLFTLPEIAVVLLAGVFIFDVRVAGATAASVVNIVVTAVIGALSFAGLGLLLASRAERIEVIIGLVNVVMLPMWLFSGVFFSYERFPEAVHPYIRLLPLTQLNDALRAVMLDGASLGSQWFALAYLAVIGLVSFGLALRWFKWL